MKRIPFSDLYFGFQPLEGYGVFRREEYTETVCVDVLRCKRCDVDVANALSLPRPGVVEVIHLSGTHSCDDGVWMFSSQRDIGKPRPNAVRVGYQGAPQVYQEIGRVQHVTSTEKRVRHRFVRAGS